MAHPALANLANDAKTLTHQLARLEGRRRGLERFQGVVREVKGSEKVALFWIVCKFAISCKHGKHLSHD